MAVPKTLRGPTASDWVDWPPSYPDQPSVNQRAPQVRLEAIRSRQSRLRSDPARLGLSPVGKGALFIAGLAFLLLALTPARADVIITNSRGGNIDAFAAYFWTLKQFGARVRIDGYCASSCTMALDLPNVCVTKRALLGFHSAYIDNFNGRVTFAAGTAQLWSHYPPGVRAWLMARGGLTPKLKYMRGTDLDAAGLTRCQ